MSHNNINLITNTSLVHTKILKCISYLWFHTSFILVPHVLITGGVLRTFAFLWVEADGRYLFVE